MNDPTLRERLRRYVTQLSPSAGYLVSEFVENYEDGAMARRDLLERVLRITGSAATAASVLLALGVKPAHADPLASASFQAQPPSAPMSPFSVPEGDPAVISADVTFPSGGATMLAYLARPNASGRFPAVLVQHENMGTAEHFRDVARRFAKNGYVALHLDLFSRQGGTNAVPANERASILTAPGAADQWVADWQAAMAYLRTLPFVQGDRIGMIGFCFGGNVTWNVAIKEPSLRAAAPFYGIPDYRDEVGNVRAAVLAVYAALDQRVDATIPMVEEQLAAHRRVFKINVYPDANHGFFNDTRPATYNEAAATAAWRDTLAWFALYLRGAALPATGDAGESAGDARTGEDDSGLEPGGEAGGMAAPAAPAQLDQPDGSAPPTADPQ